MASEDPVQKTVLPNGVRVLTQRAPGSLSAAAGVFLLSGSRHETPVNAGVSHFLEHVIFKGTRQRDVEEIAQSLESVGGSLDAYTTREHTCVSSYTLSEHLPLAMDVLGDLVSGPLLRRADVDMEREVILEEIKSYEDTPDELVHDYLAEAIWPEHPMGAPVLGTGESLAAIDERVLSGHHRSHYVGRRAVVAAAGGVDHDAVVDLVERHLSLEAGAPPDPTTPPSSYEPRVDRRVKALAQEHVCLGSPAIPFRHPDRYALILLVTVLGRGMSSRLFQRVREREGLAYTIFSYTELAEDTGLFGTYLAVAEPRTAEAIAVVLEELERIRRVPVGEDELRRSKERLKGNLILDLERNTNRMSRLAMSEVYSSRFVPIQEIAAAVDALTAEDLLRAAEIVLPPEKLSVVLHGPYEGAIPLDGTRLGPRGARRGIDSSVPFH